MQIRWGKIPKARELSRFGYALSRPAQLRLQWMIHYLRGLPLFVLPPRSPKLNGQVERSHRTHHEEFYQVIPDRWNVGSLNPQLRRWEHIYNTVRPHQALGYQTPLEFLEQWKSQSLKAECH